MIDIHCAFFGNEKIANSKKTEEALRNKIEYIINLVGDTNFLFTEFNDFNKLCHKIVTELKNKYYHVLNRVYLVSKPNHLVPFKRPKYFDENNFDNYIFLDEEILTNENVKLKRLCLASDKSYFSIYYISPNSRSITKEVYKHHIKKRNNKTAFLLSCE